MATKRVLQRKTRREWMSEIRDCLTSKGNNHSWGCLNKAGELFKIRTLSSTKVPLDIVDGMVENGTLVFHSKNTHYTYVHN